MNATTTSRDLIARVAEANGWTARHDGYGPDAVLYVKGDRAVYTQFSVKGTVTKASTNRYSIRGTGKAERVIRILAHEVR